MKDQDNSYGIRKFSDRLISALCRNRGFLALNYPVSPIWWLLLSIIILISDYLSGPFVNFPVLFLIPVLCASWYTSLWWGLALSILMSLTRVMFYFWWGIPQILSEASINALVRVIVLCGFAYLVHTNAKHTRALTKEVKILSGLLPICSSCKKIRSEDNSWMAIECYIRDHSEAQFSHSLCPECTRRLYPNLNLSKK